MRAAYPGDVGVPIFHEGGIRHERGYSRPASPTMIICGRSADGGFVSWCAAFTWASGGGGSCRFCRGVCASDGLGRPPSDRTPRAFSGARDPDRHWSGCGALSQGARPRRRRDGAAGSLHLTDLASLSQARQVDLGTPALALSEGHLHGRFLRGACGALGARGAGALGLDHCPPQGGLARRAGALATARSLGQALCLLLGRRRLLLTTARPWTLLTKVETSCDRILIAGGANVEAEWEQGPAV